MFLEIVLRPLSPLCSISVSPLHLVRRCGRAASSRNRYFLTVEVAIADLSLSKWCAYFALGSSFRNTRPISSVYATVPPRGVCRGAGNTPARRAAPRPQWTRRSGSSDGTRQNYLVWSHGKGGYVKCQVQRYYALMVQDYNAPRLDSVPPTAPTHADGACEEINGCSRCMTMYWYA